MMNDACAGVSGMRYLSCSALMVADRSMLLRSGLRCSFFVGVLRVKRKQRPLPTLRA